MLPTAPKRLKKRTWMFICKPFSISEAFGDVVVAHPSAIGIVLIVDGGHEVPWGRNGGGAASDG